MRGALRLLITVGLFSVLGALTACTEQATRVVLITVDTLRSDAFAGNKWRDSSMPRIAAIAEKGAVFDHFYSAANTNTLHRHLPLSSGFR